LTIKRPQASYDVQEFDELILYETGTYSVTIPHAKSSGRELYICNIGTGVITIMAQPLDAIQGNTSVDIAQYDTLHIIDIDTQRWIAL